MSLSEAGVSRAGVRVLFNSLETGEVCWTCPWQKAELVEGGEAFYFTACRWASVLDLSLEEAWANIGEVCWACH